MSILTDGLPDSVAIDGEVYTLHTDFRRYIRFENVMLDRGLPMEEKARELLSLYADGIPDDVETAFDAVLSFYRCGKPVRRLFGESGKRLYSFDLDDSFIQAAFMEQYGIDLTRAELHWWKFRALFDALSPETLFVKIMSWRGMRIDSKLPPEEKKRLQDLKRLYALPVQSRSEECDSLEKILMGSGNVEELFS